MLGADDLALPRVPDIHPPSRERSGADAWRPLSVSRLPDRADAQSEHGSPGRDANTGAEHGAGRRSEGPEGVPSAEAQALSRLKVRVLPERGEPLPDASVRIEALSGFLGDPYAGQRTYSVPTDKKGEWALIGFKAGIFDASARC